jgi:hypothetical protein
VIEKYKVTISYTAPTPVPANTGGYLVINHPWPGMMRTVYGNDDRFCKTYWEHIPPQAGKYMYFAGDGALLCLKLDRAKSCAAICALWRLVRKSLEILRLWKIARCSIDCAKILSSAMFLKRLLQNLLWKPFS